jgi:hypothetical protein
MIDPEVFLTFVATLDRFEGRSSLHTWLYGILIRKAKEGWRHRAREGSHDPIYDEWESRFDAAGNWLRPPVDPDQALTASELGRAIQECLAALSESQRSTFVLRQVEELSALEAKPDPGADRHSRGRAVAPRGSGCARASTGRDGGQVGNAVTTLLPRARLAVGAPGRLRHQGALTTGCHSRRASSIDVGRLRVGTRLSCRTLAPSTRGTRQPVTLGSSVTGILRSGIMLHWFAKFR